MALSAQPLEDLRVAIAHYWFVTWRGGEKVVESMLRLFPRADIYTLFLDREACGEHLAGHHVSSSLLDSPLTRRHHQKLFPLFPMAVRSLRLRGPYDLVISSESGPIKGLRLPAGVPHLCYIHSPMRYCWGFTDDYVDAMPRWFQPMARMLFERLRRYDESTIDNVTQYVANSQNVRDRVRRYYGREAAVVHPPIADDLFVDRRRPAGPISERAYYLSFGAITPYKGIGLLVDAFNRSGRPLIVVGEGSERAKLERLARPNVRFLGELPFDRIRSLIVGAKALLFPGEEDFGMIPLEVMAHGVPVLALGRGGALETVVEDRSRVDRSSGLFFPEATVEQVEKAIVEFEAMADRFDPDWIFAHAARFREEVFLDGMRAQIRQVLARV